MRFPTHRVIAEVWVTNTCGSATPPRSNNPGMEQPPRLLLNAAGSLSKVSGRPATVPWWRQTAEISWNGYTSRRVAWYDGPGRIRLENSAVFSLGKYRREKRHLF